MATDPPTPHCHFDKSGAAKSHASNGRNAASHSSFRRKRSGAAKSHFPMVRAHGGRQAQQEITEYFAGRRQSFEVALDTPGSEFQRAVWRHLQYVSFGETTHYQSIAMDIGKPTATRAVAAANGANRVAIIIPCHRIIGKDGSMTGYGGGIARKIWLINHEATIREKRG